MRPLPLKTRPLDEALRRMGAKLESWQVRALFLGAHASTNLRLGPQHLLDRICGDAPIMGDDLADANANLQSLMALWNELVEDHDADRVRLSPVRRSKSPSADELNGLIARRSGEITWFLRGIEAGGDDPIEFGDEGVAMFRRLAEASAFLESYQELLTRSDSAEFGKARKALDQLTGAIERIIGDLLSISQDLRKQAMAEYQQNAGRRTDDGVPIRRPVKVGRNEPCPCGSGKKWKRCCGAPSSLQ
jgi:hypothetical protein